MGNSCTACRLICGPRGTHGAWILVGGRQQTHITQGEIARIKLAQFDELCSEGRISLGHTHSHNGVKFARQMLTLAQHTCFVSEGVMACGAESDSVLPVLRTHLSL